MKEILTWGEGIPKQFERMGIQAKQTYAGTGRIPSVHDVTDQQFDALCAGTEEHWRGTDAAWIWSEGSNKGSPDKRVSVNGHWLFAWNAGKHATLLGYLCDAEGVSTEKNVAACVADLAKYNQLTVGALFMKYQPTDRDY